jgi:hypothetical protein
MRNKYTAAKIMVKPATAPNTISAWKAPFSNKNSPIKPLVNGNAAEPNTIIKNAVANLGATLAIPPSCVVS